MNTFSYNWTYSNNNTSLVSGLSPMNTFVTIYDNSLNTSWQDLSLAPEYSLENTQCMSLFIYHYFNTNYLFQYRFLFCTL